jgi:hypothetical protein
MLLLLLWLFICNAGYGLGMMNLEVLKLGHNKINGPLPVSRASSKVRL